MMNNVTLVGRLTRDPELRYTPAGVAVTSFTLACDRPFSNANREREADFISIVVWRQQAETAAEYLRKGRIAGVTGRIETRSYDHDEKGLVYVTEVVADNVRFFPDGSKQEEAEQPKEEPKQQQRQQSGGNNQSRQGRGGGSANRSNGGSNRGR